MKLCTFTPLYNEYGKHLRRNLDSQEKLGVEMAYFSDGCWHKLIDNKARKNGLSYDGTRELIKEYKFTQTIDCGWMGEIASINKTFKIAARDGFPLVLQLAADEWITGDLNRLIDNSMDAISFDKRSGYWIEFVTHHITPPDQKFDKLVRLFHNPGFIRLRHIHWWYFYCNKPLQYGGMIHGVKIHHDDRPRKKGREKSMLKFQKWQTKHDEALLKQLTKYIPPNRITQHQCGCEDGDIYSFDRGIIAMRPHLKRCPLHLNVKVSKKL